MSQHTPGPWTTYEHKPGEHYICHLELGLAKVYNAKDARLIAAAPAMLEALKRIKELMDSGDIDGKDWTEYQQVHNAIAQAEGR